MLLTFFVDAAEQAQGQAKVTLFILSISQVAAGLAFTMRLGFFPNDELLVTERRVI